MKISYPLFVIFLAFISCDPENLDPCSPEVLDGKKFQGQANICNAMPQQQLYFKSQVSLSVIDTFLHITLISQDTSLSFEYKDTVVYKCYEVEPDYFVFSLFKNGLDIGSIGPHAANISINLKVDGCIDNSSYDGVLIK